MNIVAHNLLAMNAQRQFNITSRKTSKVMEKLSSGYKINRAADDAAGLSISEKMRRQIRGLTQASANAQDGISMIMIADGALSEVHEMLHRGTELSIKAANGTLTDTDRAYIQQEIDHLKAEIDSISEKTTFNEIPVLKGKDIPPLISEKDDLAVVGSLPAWVSSPSLSSKSLSEEYTTQERYIDTSVTPNTEQYYSVNHESATLDFSSYTGTDTQIKELTKGGFYTTCCTCENHYSIKFTEGTSSEVTNSGNHYIYSIGISGTANASELIDRIIAGTNNGIPRNHFTKLVKDGDTLVIYDQRRNKNNTGVPTNNSSTNWPDWTHAGSTANSSPGSNRGSFGPGVAMDLFDALEALEYKSIPLQIGADASQHLMVDLPSISTLMLGLRDTSVTTQENADMAINAFKRALEYVSTERSKLGAYQNRLEHTILNLDNVTENTQASESLLRDADMATLMVEHSNNSILLQAGQAMMAQANQSNRGVLNLLS